MGFLESSEIRPRAFTLSIRGLLPKEMFLGQGSQGLEIVVFSSESKPGTVILHEDIELLTWLAISATSG
mgnify:CR=1 FL=1|jgi:hypothetical protein